MGPILAKKKFERKTSSTPTETAAPTGNSMRKDLITFSLLLLLFFSGAFGACCFPGSVEDKMDTLPLHADAQEDVGELQSKPRHTGKVQQIPHLDPPVCLPAVVIDLEINPLSGLDPWAQHKKQFKAAKEASKRGQG